MKNEHLGNLKCILSYIGIHCHNGFYSTYILTFDNIDRVDLFIIIVIQV